MAPKGINDCGVVMLCTGWGAYIQVMFVSGVSLLIGLKNAGKFFFGANLKVRTQHQNTVCLVKATPALAPFGRTAVCGPLKPLLTLPATP